MSSRGGLGPLPLGALIVASMIGSGVFTTSGFALKDLGAPGAVVVAWALGALHAVLGAASYGWLAPRVPESGGEYVLVSRTVHPAAGYVEAPPLTPPAADPPPIAFACTIEERYEKERVRQGVLEFGFIEKMTLMFPLAFAAIAGGALAYSAFDDGVWDGDDTAELALGSVLLADAVGITAILLFMPPTKREWETLADGTFRPRARGCPTDLALERDGRRMAVDERGWLSSADEAFLVRAMADGGGGVDVVHRGARVTLTPPRAQVCRWAADRGLQPTDCGGAGEARDVPAGAVFPLSSPSVAIAVP